MADYHSLAKEFGTPLYVYDERTFEEKFQALDSALSAVRHLICYAVKANSNLSILKAFHQLGSGFDIVSEGELRRVISAGASTDRVVFAGVGKTADEIEFALTHQIRLFNVESAAELGVIAQVAQKLRKKAPIGFRINPDVRVETHPYLATGLKTSKFGIPISSVLELFEVARTSQWLEVVGVDCHIGSQITDVKPLEEAYTSVLETASALKSKGAPIKYIDFGGGLGVSYSGRYEALDISAYASLVGKLSAGTPYEYLVEPGKFLIAEAGKLLTRVLYMKDNGGHKFAVVDAGMNDLIRPSLYDAFHRIDRVPSHDEPPGYEREKEVVDVVGPVCETGCYLAKQRSIAMLNEGDLLAINDAGAYGFAMASNYNSRRLPAEVLIDRHGAPFLIRRREEYEDIWHNEILHSR